MVVLYYLEGDIEFAGELVSCADRLRTGPLLSRIRWSQRAPARFRVASGVSRVSRIRLFWWHRVLPVVELVDEDVACLALDELPVDEDGPADFIVDGGQPSGRSMMLMVTFEVSA